MTYFRLRQRLKAHGIDLPAEKRYRDAARSMRPLVKRYQENPGEDPIGVKADLKPSLEHTFKAIMENVENNKSAKEKDGSENVPTSSDETQEQEESDASKAKEGEKEVESDETAAGTVAVVNGVCI